MNKLETLKQQLTQELDNIVAIIRSGQIDQINPISIVTIQYFSSDFFTIDYSSNNNNGGADYYMDIEISDMFDEIEFKLRKNLSSKQLEEIRKFLIAYEIYNVGDFIESFLNDRDIIPGKLTFEVPYGEFYDDMMSYIIDKYSSGTDRNASLDIYDFDVDLKYLILPILGQSLSYKLLKEILIDIPDAQLRSHIEMKSMGIKLESE